VFHAVDAVMASVRRTASLPLAYVPAIHVMLLRPQNANARDKPGHDDFKYQW
jgi:hypothetical protein